MCWTVSVTWLNESLTRLAAAGCCGTFTTRQLPPPPISIERPLTKLGCSRLYIFTRSKSAARPS